MYTKDRCTELVRNVAFGIGYHAMHHEASKGFSPIYEYPVQLEPAWEEFNPSVSYRMGQPPVSALPAAPSESWYVVQLHIPKCITIDWDRYEFLTASLSTFPAITSFEIVGKQEKATFYIGSSSPTHVAVLADLWRTACPDLLTVPAEDPFPQMESSPEQFFDLYTTAPYYREFTTRSIVSPLTNFIRSLSSLQPNEWAFYQVLFTPVKNNWSINIQSLLQAESVLGAGAPWGKSRLPMVKKHDKPLFAARVRYGCSSENPKVRTALQAFAGQFSFDGQACRSYTRNDFQKILKDPVIHQIRTRTTHTTGMIVASNELSIFVHLPETIHLGITLDLASGFMPSQRLTEPGRPLGYHGCQRTLVSLPDSEANKCLFMIGSSRRGKSNSMIHQILYLAQTGNGVGFIDPHRTTAFEILELLPISLRDRVVWCDFDDLEYTVAYNPFDAADSYGRLAVEITNSFKNLFDATSFHRMTHLLGNTLHALFDLKRNLQTIPALIARTEEGEALRQQVIRQTQNNEIRRFWKEEFKTYSAEAFAPILNRHSSLFMDETAQRVFSQNGNKIEIDRIMNESKILIVALPASIDVAALIGGMLIAQTQKAALARIGKSASKNPFYLFIDEFHRFSTGRIIESIINETVKAGLHLCLANQETGQLNDELLKAVLSVPNIMVFNVNYLDARRLTSIFNDRVAIEDILSLKVGEVFARLDNDIIDFRCPAPLKNRDPKAAWEMIEESRRHYYVARQKPETKSSKRLRRDIDTF